jgi:hypothetical protein
MDGPARSCGQDGCQGVIEEGLGASVEEEEDQSLIKRLIQAPGPQVLRYWKGL